MGQQWLICTVATSSIEIALMNGSEMNQIRSVRLVEEHFLEMQWNSLRIILEAVKK